MNNTTNATESVPPKLCHEFDIRCIGTIVTPVLGACILLAIIIVIVVCYQKTKRRIVRVHLPNPDDIDLHPQGGNDEAYRPANNTSRELPALPTNETDQRHKEVVTVTLTSAPLVEKPPQAKSPNYLNVDTFLFPTGKGGHNNDNDDDDDKHDYENNPIERKKYEDEQKRKKQVNPGHAKTLQVGASAPSPSERNAKSFQMANHSPKLSSNSGGSRDLASPGNSAGHSPGRKGYINMSKSLENLDKRTVPQPPPLPSNPVIKVPSMERHCSPPKPHLGKSSGYINQPA